MRVLALTFGTRGDVEPFLALAQRLIAEGHQAELAVPRKEAQRIREAGIPVHELDDGPLAIQEQLAGTVAESHTPLAKLRLARQLPTTFGQVVRDAWDAADRVRPDVLVHNGQVMAGVSVAEKLGVPAVLGLPLPMYVRTREFPCAGFDLPSNLPGWLNRLSFLGMRLPTLTFGRMLDEWRSEHGLPRRRHRHNPLVAPPSTAGKQSPAWVLHGVSPSVVPRPSNWPPHASITGYWFTSGDGTGLTPELEEFLAAGDPPVYIGFGSVLGNDPEATARHCVEAITAAGVRAVIATGWGGLRTNRTSDDILVIEGASHAELFPRVAAVVHHGGAGTTAAAARAGRPQVVCPFTGDQPFWGRRMHRLGVAGEPLPQKRIDAESLTARIRGAVEDSSLSDNAERLGAAIRRQDGTGEAVRALERIATT